MLVTSCVLSVPPRSTDVVVPPLPRSCIAVRRYVRPTPARAARIAALLRTAAVVHITRARQITLHQKGSEQIIIVHDSKVWIITTRPR